MRDLMPGMIGKLKLYLGTDVLLSLFLDPPSGGGEAVARLLKEAADGKYLILVSEHTVSELLGAGVPREIVDQALRPMLMLQGGDLLVVNDDVLRGALKVSRMYENVPFMAALHVVFAQRNNALILTRDQSFRLSVRNLAGVMAPEDLLR